MITTAAASPAASQRHRSLPLVHDPVTVDPAAVQDLTVSGEPLPGLLLDWRWLDRERGRWLGLVRVRTATLLQFERWVGGEHVRRVEPESHKEVTNPA